MCGQRLSTAKKRPSWANTAMPWPPALITEQPRCLSSATEPTRTRSAAMTVIDGPSWYPPAFVSPYLSRVACATQRLPLSRVGCAHACVECCHHVEIEGRIQQWVERLAGL